MCVRGKALKRENMSKNVMENVNKVLYRAQRQINYCWFYTQKAVQINGDSMGIFVLKPIKDEHLVTTITFF